MKRIAFLAVFLVFAFHAFAMKGGETSLSTWMTAMLSKVVQMTEQRVAQDDNVPVAVAGLRGTEQRGEKMEPYWKGDLTARSADYQAYREIEKKMQEGKYAEALKLITAFKGKYAQSKLSPEVRFTMGLAYAGLGQNKQAVATFEELIKLYPEHELVEASKEGITRLKKA